MDDHDHDLHDLDAASRSKIAEQRNKREDLDAAKQRRLELAEAKEGLPSTRVMMPAMAVAEHTDAGAFWKALRRSVQLRYFDPAGVEGALARPRLYLLAGDRRIRVTAERLAIWDTVSDGGCIDQAWTSVDVWWRWCAERGIALPARWLRYADERQATVVEAKKTTPGVTSLPRISHENAVAVLKQCEADTPGSVTARSAQALIHDRGFKITKREAEEAAKAITGGTKGRRRKCPETMSRK